MHNYLLIILKRVLLIGVLLASSLIGWTQEYHNGVRKGMIKVKFSPTISSSLSEIQVNARRDKLTTGIKAFDEAAESMSATNMYRLFPYDAKHETQLRKHGLHLWYVVEIAEGIDPKTAVAKMKQLKEVTVAEVEREKRIAPFTVSQYNDNTASFAALPFNDPMLKDQWHYENAMIEGGADINLFEAWTETAGANNVIVSVHDQGVDVNHPDLKENIWTNTIELNGAPGVDDDANGYIDDIHGYNFEHDRGALDPQFHGTHVAGTIAAVNNNGIGVSGIAGGSGNDDGVKIMSLQILGGAPIELSYIYAANNGAVISQNSWGYTTPGFVDQSVLDAIDYFIDEAGAYPGSPMKGGIVIFAAGNSNSLTEYYPAYYERVMAVSALGPDWKKASYSNYGDWVEISAPGGDQATSPKNGVLSTIPDGQYAYIQGTSMACPHVSGIAALALANRTKQLTNSELWNKLMTGVVGVDEHNPDLKGKLGVGAIDAALAIRNDQVKAPLAVNDLALTGIAQEFAAFKWTVPADEDDSKPTSFTLYYNTQPITAANKMSAARVSINNDSIAGKEFVYEVNGLLGLTTYYFAITSTDRWGNESALSNEVTDTTNEGPSIVVDENSSEINLTIDASQSTKATHDITISNDATGLLRWNHFVRHISNYSTFNASALDYPAVKTMTSSTPGKIRMGVAHDALTKLRSSDPAPMYYETISKRLSDVPTNIIGEVDTTLTNSAAARFFVTEAEGFNLTNLQMYLKADPAKGPVIVEIYKGDSPTKNNLVLAQEYMPWSDEEATAYITLNEQLYFESGSTFFVVFHVPSGNIFPLGIGLEEDASASANCFMSFNLGGSWESLEKLLDSKDFAWSLVASSFNPFLGTYISLEPGSGDIEGNGEQLTTLTANAATLVNGSYSANLVLASNDGEAKELRIPVNVTVTGHEPDIKHIHVADFGNVFQGTSKTLQLVLDNQGYGNLSELSFSTSDPQFSIVDGGPWEISARNQEVIKVTFAPTTIGGVNASLTFTNGVKTYEIALFGAGIETSEISVTPASQVIPNIVLGDKVQAEITVENTGAYPLKYFIPGHDTKGISTNWPTKFHTYGYQMRTNRPSEANPLPYQFQDISATGTKITEHFKLQNWYYEVDMGFEFPYYGEKLNKIYIAKRGFTTFDKTVNPLNVPYLNNKYTPKGFISPIGTMIDYAVQGDIYYSVQPDRVIIQYSNIWDGVSVGETITAQMVLFYNGDIRFYYSNMGFSEYNQLYLNILIEDLDKKDGILVSDYEHPMALFSDMAIGFDYPGPNIITSTENGSGVVMPGNSSVVKLNLETASQTEGAIKRFVNFISNDPANPSTTALVQLDITSGGVPNPVVSTDTLDFGDVFQGAVRSKSFTVKNEGTKNVQITNITGMGTQFPLTGPSNVTIIPGLYRAYSVRISTTTLGPLTRTLTISYADATVDRIVLKGKIIEAPGIAVDLTPLVETLAFGDTSTHALSIKNTGKADLEVVAVGKQWLTFDANDSQSAQVANNTYTYEKHNKGGVYQWIDIRKTGKQLPFAQNLDDKKQYWRNLELPFPFEYYGKTYTKIKIGENGIISFDEDPNPMWFEDFIPTEKEGVFLMPYWCFGGFNTTFYEKSDVGLFYQLYDDKIIISWHYLINNFGGMGDPISAQVVLYKNSTIKFQYRVEEEGSDQTSVFTSIGTQQSPSSGVVISNHNTLDHGQGLAYVLVPAKKHIIHSGDVLAGQINIDARNIYGGQYNEVLNIQTNVPGLENLAKPVQLTVTGEGVLTLSDTIDFGEKMILYDHGMPVANFQDIEIRNTGSAALDINWAKMIDGTKNMSLVIWALADGWIDKEWRWVDITEMYNDWATETPTYTLLPGDRLDAKAIFYPVEEGEFNDELVLTTSLGDKKVVFEGSAVEPPAIRVTTASVKVVMNTPDETVDKKIKFNNLKGKSSLKYEISIDYGRPNTSVTSEAISDIARANSSITISNVEATSGGTTTFASYNRAISHTDKQVAEGAVGLGGGVPFTVGTKYNAGPEGFNISHIETWLFTGELTEGTIKAEVRAGGTNIANAVKVASGTLDFTGSGSDTKGSWTQIALDEPAALYPNETFYVIITYPMGIVRPQGTLKNEPNTLGRYFYFDGDFWEDIQEVKAAGFSTLAFLMYAAEQTPTNSAWLSITSPIEGVLQKGDTSSVSIKFHGSIATRGDQVAKVVITSNDPLVPTVAIPVSLHLNEAPKFTNVPVEIQIGEKQTLTLKIGVKDAEGHTVTVKAGGTYAGVTHTFENGLLSITINKDYGQAGAYTYKFTATDQYDAVSELTLPVNVIHTNRAPVLVGEETLTYYSTGRLEEYSIEDFFSDPDGDTFAFSVSSSDLKLVDVFASKGQFLVRPISAGEAKLAFTVTDGFGAITKDTITVTVNNVLGIEEANAGLKIFPNPVQHTAQIFLGNEWRGDVIIHVMDAAGKSHIVHNADTNGSREVQLDVSSLRKGFYILKVISADKQQSVKLIKE